MCDKPETLIEAVRFFSNLDVCNEYMKGVKWPDGVIVCPKCGGDRVGEIKTRKMLRCKDCRKQFSYKVGSIFEDSPLSLDKWFVAVWCVTNAKNGISSYEIARALGITQKSAWHMLHRIRLAMKDGSFKKKMSGQIESDETLVGGRAKFMHKHVKKQKITGTGPAGKTIVHGMSERARIEQQFHRLAEQWKKETGHLSRMSKRVRHPAYGQIIALGGPAIQLLLRDLKESKDDWFSALSELTGENPVAEEDAGFVDRMATAWIEWARTRGYDA